MNTKLYIVLVSGLLTGLTSFADYNPRGFGMHVTIKDHRTIPGIIINMHDNPPLYFTMPGNERDYVKSVLFNISQRTNSKKHTVYDIDYEIISYNNSYVLETKSLAASEVEPILKHTFPEVFTSESNTTTVEVLHTLRENRDNSRTLLKNCVDLINAFITTKLNLDEKDFMKRERSEWSWFSLNDWRNWWAWRNER